MENIANVRVGKPQTKMSKPSHVRGVGVGNWPDHKQAGIEAEGPVFRATARRSTGVAPEAREPIDPDMPNLTPP